MMMGGGYCGGGGNVLTRQTEQKAFEPVLGHRFNPNLHSPLLAVLTDAQSFYNSFQFSFSQQSTHHVSWQAYYTLAHSIDDASTGLIIEAVNEPPGSQNIFDRKGSRGRSSVDIRHNFFANAGYELS